MSVTDRRPDDRENQCGCRIDIHIDSKGDVNIYSCTSPGSPPAGGGVAGARAIRSRRASACR